MATEKKVDAVAAASERICAHMNNDHAPSCLAYAWHLLNQKSAVTARMTSISSSGFTLSITTMWNSSSPSSLTYTFSTPVADANEARIELVRLHGQCFRPFVPTDPAAFLTILAYLVVATRLLSTQPGDVPLLGNLAFWIFAQSSTALFILKAVLAIHFLEVIYVIYLCRELKLSIPVIISWLPLVQIFGFPVTRKIQTLHKLKPKSKPKQHEH